MNPLQTFLRIYVASYTTETIVKVQTVSPFVNVGEQRRAELWVQAAYALRVVGDSIILLLEANKQDFTARRESKSRKETRIVIFLE